MSFRIVSRALDVGRRVIAVCVFVASGVAGAGLCDAIHAEQTGQDTGLRIVVIAGEGSVNIVQQKTAVAPIVEVRDRNDLPVAGATVTFTLGGGNTASFAGGVQTLSVATNAAGRAAVTALNPMASGAVQINVQAAFQGQAAVATIAQTNVMTAAEAAAAGSGTGAASGGTAGGGGGGLSNTAIAGIAGGAGAAAAAAKTLGGGDDASSPSTAAPRTTTYTGSFTTEESSSVLSPTQNCVSTSTISGTLTMTLQQGPGGAVTGNAVERDARTIIAISAPTCNQSNLGATFNGGVSVPVSGTENALAFNTQLPYSSSSAGVTSSGIHTWTFSGGIANGVVTGTLTFVDTAEGTGNVGQPLIFRRSWTAPVTLR